MLTCNYEIFCNASATHIYELISDLFTQHKYKTEKKRHALLKRIQNWAHSHIELKETSRIVDGINDASCKYQIDLNKKALAEIISAFRSELDANHKEALLLNWFEHTFLPSEKHCVNCPYNKKNQL